MASNGLGNVSPNPMVGCVVVHQNRIIGEGWHQRYGEAHAEVNAIRSVADKTLLAESTVYVTLEPCSHFGKTPPCADLLIKHQVKKVVVGMVDPFEKVSGQGIQKLKDAGIQVEVGVLEEQCRELNKRYLTYLQHKRPYVFLKWAQSVDGFMAPDAGSMSAEEFERKRHITGLVVQRLTHKWRGEEDAIMVGTRTVETDNPSLNTRAWPGRNPLRITIDKNLRLPASANMLDDSQPTLVFTAKTQSSTIHTHFVTIDFNGNVPAQILQTLYERHIQSVIIEGGSITLNHFIEQGLWDEIQLFESPALLGAGVKAPVITGKPITLQTQIDHKTLTIYRNRV